MRSPRGLRARTVVLCASHAGGCLAFLRMCGWAVPPLVGVIPAHMPDPGRRGPLPSMSPWMFTRQIPCHWVWCATGTSPPDAGSVQCKTMQTIPLPPFSTAPSPTAAHLRPPSRSSSPCGPGLQRCKIFRGVPSMPPSARPPLCTQHHTPQLLLHQENITLPSEGLFSSAFSDCIGTCRGKFMRKFWIIFFKIIQNFWIILLLNPSPGKHLAGQCGGGPLLIVFNPVLSPCPPP